MSLIILNSQQQNPANFQNHFPQPIEVKPHSQVCLLKFIHFREGNLITITQNNNRLWFLLGSLGNDARRLVLLDTGSYTDNALAQEIQNKMNDVLQQQNYTFYATVVRTGTVGFTQIQISFASVPTPREKGGTWIDFYDDDAVMEIRNDDIDGHSSIIIPKTYPSSVKLSAFMYRGILTHYGTYEVADIPYSNNPLTFGDRSEDFAPTFIPTEIGLIRKRYSNPNEIDLNLKFDSGLQDIRVAFTSEGKIIVSSAQFGVPTTVPIYKQLAEIPQNIVEQIATNITIKNVVIATRWKVQITMVGSQRRFIVQLLYSEDYGKTYNYPANIPGYVSFVEIDDVDYNGVIFVGTATPSAGQFQTKNAPFIPTLTTLSTDFDENPVAHDEFGCPNLASVDLTFINNSNETLDFAPIDGGGGLNEYEGSVFDANLNLLHEYKLTGNVVGDNRLQFAYTEIGGARDTGTFDYDCDNVSFTQTTNDGRTVNWDLQNPTAPSGFAFIQTPPQFLVDGVFNTTTPNLLRTATHLGITEGELLDRHSAETGNDTTAEEGTTLGSDLQKQAVLYLRKLQHDDLVANPAVVKQAMIDNPEQSGNCGSTIGAVNNLYKIAQSAGATIFTSDIPLQKEGKETFLHISIPELQGVKSYEGKISNVGKTIAVIPRDELTSSTDEGADNRYCYVSHLENWIDINNGNTLNLNQFSCEIRSPNGILLEDMLDSSVVVMKIRQDPAIRQMEHQEKVMKMLLPQTGQILSQNLQNTGS